MNDIYKAPESSISESQEVVEGAPDYKLFKLPSVGIATFFGTMIAGGLIMSLNYRRLGDAAKGNQVVGISIAATIAVMVLAALLPPQVPGIIFTIAQILAMNAWAKSVQETAVNTHLEAGGEMESNWLAFGISLLVLLAVVLMAGVIIGVAFPEIF